MNESHQGRYEYSSTQANLPDSLADRIIAWGKDAIPETDVFRDSNDPSFGREDEIHVTILYGLLDSSFEPVKQLLQDQESFEVRLGKISVFDTNEKFDVVKIEVQGDGLFKLNKLLKTNLKYKTNFPTYRPHVTIAYTLKGKGQKYRDEEPFNGQKFKVEEITFSSKNGTKHSVKLKSNKAS